MIRNVHDHKDHKQDKQRNVQEYSSAQNKEQQQTIDALTARAGPNGQHAHKRPTKLGNASHNEPGVERSADARVDAEPACEGRHGPEEAHHIVRAFWVARLGFCRHHDFRRVKELSRRSDVIVLYV